MVNKKKGRKNRSHSKLSNKKLLVKSMTTTIEAKINVHDFVVKRRKKKEKKNCKTYIFFA